MFSDAATQSGVTIVTGKKQWIHLNAELLLSLHTTEKISYNYMQYYITHTHTSQMRPFLFPVVFQWCILLPTYLVCMRRRKGPDYNLLIRKR